MSGHRSPDEVRAHSVAEMPAPLGEIRYHLHDEVAWLHLKWKTFRALFVKSPETVDVLNATAPVFFNGLQRMTWEDVLLHLSRLTDHPKSCGKDTLTVMRLAPLVDDPALRARVLELAESAKVACDFARDWRNRRLAHRELPPLDGVSPSALKEATVGRVETALKSLRDVMNAIEIHYLKEPVAYEYAIEAPGGADALLSHLRRSLGLGRRRPAFNSPFMPLAIAEES